MNYNNVYVAELVLSDSDGRSVLSGIAQSIPTAMDGCGYA